MQGRPAELALPLGLVLETFFAPADSQNRLLNSHAMQPEDMSEEEEEEREEGVGEEVKEEVEDDEEEKVEEEQLVTRVDSAMLPSLAITSLLPSLLLLLLSLLPFCTTYLPFEHGSNPFLFNCIC